MGLDFDPRGIAAVQPRRTKVLRGGRVQRIVRGACGGSLNDTGASPILYKLSSKGAGIIKDEGLENAGAVQPRLLVLFEFGQFS